MDTRAVARLAVGIDRPAVPDRLERLDAGFDDLPAFLAVDGHDKADPAGGLFLLEREHPMLRHPLALGLFGGGPVFVIDGHCMSPSGTNG